MSDNDEANNDVTVMPSAWAKANAEFVQDLTSEEQLIYRNASIDTIMADMETANATLKASKSRLFIDKISPFIETVRGYGSAMDVFSNACPLVMSPLWGGIRMILHLALSYGSYLRNLADLIAQISEVLPQYAIYGTLFNDHDRVATAVGQAFLDVLHFCKDVKRILKKAKVLRFKLLWSTFCRDFNIAEFHKHKENVLREVELAHMVDARQSRIAVKANQVAAQARSIAEQQWQNQTARRSFLDSLYSCDYESYKNMVPHHVPGTCEWLLTHGSFWKWWQGHLCLLFVALGPAMGKSVLARAVIDHLNSSDVIHVPEVKYEKTVCYFFFGDEDSRCDARIALSALLHQLFCAQSKLLDRAYEVNKSIFNQHSFGALWDTFTTILRGDHHANIVWVLDGLDHCEEKSRLFLLEKLTSLLRGPLERSRLKVIITGRPLSHIQDTLDESPISNRSKLLGQSGVENQQIQTEINLFIQSRLNRFQGLRHKRINAFDDVTGDLRRWISSTTNHNYLWVSFIFETLDKNAGLSRHDLKEIVESLPKSCSDFYEHTLSRCSHPQKTRTLLYAVVGAARPLTLHEMNYVLSLRKEQKSLADVDLVPGFNLAKTLQELCGFFINIVDGRVHLMHQTAKEFLLEDDAVVRSSSSPDTWMHSLKAGVSHGIMAEACLTFLQFKSSNIQQPGFDEKVLCRDSNLNLTASWRHDHAKDINTIDAYLKQHPFLQYAALHWYFHLEKSDPGAAAAMLSSLDSQICDPKSTIWKTWFGVFIKNWQGFGTIPPFNNRLHFAAWFGFTQEVEHLIKHNECGPNEKLFALAAAHIRGSRNITKLFFDHDLPELKRLRSLEQRSKDITRVFKQVQETFPDIGHDFCE